MASNRDTIQLIDEAEEAGVTFTKVSEDDSNNSPNGLEDKWRVRIGKFG